jgi:hypothetical protein
LPAVIAALTVFSVDGATAMGVQRQKEMATSAGIGAVAEVDPYGTAIGDSCSAWALGGGFLRRTNDKQNRPAPGGRLTGTATVVGVNLRCCEICTGLQGDRGRFALSTPTAKSADSHFRLESRLVADGRQAKPASPGGGTDRHRSSRWG